MICLLVLSVAVLGGTACSSSATNGGGGTGAGTAAVTGEWIYTAVEWMEGGQPKTLSISGNLSLRQDGTWEHNRVIGGITASGRGTFTATDTHITLTHRDGSQDLNYDSIVGSHVDQGGKSFRALSLSFISQGTKSTYVLVEDI